MINIETVSSCTKASRLAADGLVHALREHTPGNKLLLLSGGSSAKVAYWATSNLDINATNSTTVAQVDERYGSVGHKNSNWKHLLDSGLEPMIFHQYSEILKLGVSASDIAQIYSRRLQEFIDEAEYKVALLGLGADGHIAGMLPMEESRFNELFLGDNLVASYEADDFDRITVTAKALLQMDEIIIYVCGRDKLQAVSQLNQELAIHQAPSQLLKNCSGVTIFYGQEDS